MGTFSPEEMKELKELTKLGFTPEQIVQLKAKPVIENVAAPVVASDETEEELPTFDAKEAETLEQMTIDIMPHLLEKRHLEIFDWLVKATRDKPGNILRSMVRAAVIRERPAWREASGYGGGSSKNLEVLSERLTPVKVKD